MHEVRRRGVVHGTHRSRFKTQAVGDPPASPKQAGFREMTDKPP